MKTATKEDILGLIEIVLCRKVTNDDKYISNNTLDSLSQIDLAVLIENKYSVKVSPLDMNPENFDNSESITNYINHKLSASEI